MNRTRSLPPSIGVSLALVIFAPTTRVVAAEPESYPLVCRGSADLQPTTEMLGDMPNSVSLRFKKGSRPATSGLSPGECSWLDRGLRESEPDRLTEGIWSTPGYSAFKKRDERAKWLVPIRDPATYWTFHVYNRPEDATFAVTESRPYEEKIDGPIARPAVGPDLAATGLNLEAGRTSQGAVGEPASTSSVVLVVPGLEPNTDRPGGDYQSFELAEARPELCRQACAEDPKCRAYTYVKPGVQGPAAACWLKSAAPAPTPSDCCVSGVKGSS